MRDKIVSVGLEAVVKVMNHTRLWDIELTWYSPSAFHWICLNSLEHCLIIHSFKPTGPSLTFEVLATQAKLLQLSSYYTKINCACTFHTTNVFGNFVQKTTLHIHLYGFQNHTHEWSNAHVNKPTTAGTYHGLNCFDHVIYALQTSTYDQNIAKLLTHSSKCIDTHI